MTFHIISIFPEVFEKYLNTSMLWRAQNEKLVKFKLYNPRDFSKDKHKKVDHRPYGGGPGMVMTVDPILRAVKKAVGKKTGVKIILFTPRGKQFTNTTASAIAKKYKDVVLISGRYEGIDARVRKILKADMMSIGPYVLTGGEVPAMVVVDAVSRQIPGVLGNPDSVEERRVSGDDVYTRPEVYIHNKKKYPVPKVLLTGHASNIENWKKNNSKDK